MAGVEGALGGLLGFGLGLGDRGRGVVAVWDRDDGTGAGEICGWAVGGGRGG